MNMRLFRQFCLITGILLIAAAILLTLFFGYTVGNGISLFAGVLFLGLYWIYPRLSKFQQRILTIKLVAFVVFMIGLFILIGRNDMKDTTTFTEDCALVLGCGIKDGEALPTLKLRLDKCIEYLQYNPDVLIIVSGGESKTEKITESEVMKRYLVSKGVDADRIIKEDQSKNTRQNMLFSKTLLDTYFPTGDYSIVCITSGYHAYRAGKLAQKANLRVSHYNSRILWYIYPAAYCRETLSIIKVWLGL